MTLTQNYKFAKFVPKTEMCFNFYEIWHLEQIKHVQKNPCIKNIVFGTDNLDPKL